MTKAITVPELDKPLEWRPHRDHVVGIPKCAELLLPEGKGWEWHNDDCYNVTKEDDCWLIEKSSFEALLDPAIIEVRWWEEEGGVDPPGFKYPNEWTQRVRVVDVLAVEQWWELGGDALRCVVVPA